MGMHIHLRRAKKRRYGCWDEALYRPSTGPYRPSGIGTAYTSYISDCPISRYTTEQSLSIEWPNSRSKADTSYNGISAVYSVVEGKGTDIPLRGCILSSVCPSGEVLNKRIYGYEVRRPRLEAKLSIQQGTRDTRVSVVYGQNPFARVLMYRFEAAGRRRLDAFPVGNKAFHTAEI